MAYAQSMNVPSELTKVEHWILSDGKIPVDATRRPVSYKTCKRYDLLMALVGSEYLKTDFGFCFCGQKKYIGIDIDWHDHDTPSDDQKRFIEACLTETYAELSTSHKGVHIIVKAPENIKPFGKIVYEKFCEVYWTDGWLKWTGDQIGDTDSLTCPLVAKQLIEHLATDLEKRACISIAKILLHPDHSESIISRTNQALRIEYLVSKDCLPGSMLHRYTFPGSSTVNNVQVISKDNIAIVYSATGISELGRSVFDPFGWILAVRANNDFATAAKLAEDLL
jgi:hypothetical protein